MSKDRQFYETLHVGTGFYTKEAFQIFNAFRFVLRDVLKPERGNVSSIWFSRVFSDAVPAYEHMAYWTKSEIEIFKVLQADDGEVILKWPHAFNKSIDTVALSNPAATEIDKIIHCLSRLAKNAHYLFKTADVSSSMAKKAEIGYELICSLGYEGIQFNTTLRIKFKYTEDMLTKLIGAPNDVFKTISITNLKDSEATIKERQQKELEALSRKIGAEHTALVKKYQQRSETAYANNQDDKARAWEKERNQQHYLIMLKSQAAESELKKKFKAELQQLREELRQLKAI